MIHLDFKDSTLFINRFLTSAKMKKLQGVLTLFKRFFCLPFQITSAGKIHLLLFSQKKECCSYSPSDHYSHQNLFAMKVGRNPLKLFLKNNAIKSLNFFGSLLMCRQSNVTLKSPENSGSGIKSKISLTKYRVIFIRAPLVIGLNEWS